MISFLQKQNQQQSIGFWGGALRIWLLTSSFYAFQFFLRSTPNAMAPFWIKDFHIGPETLGWISAIYYLPYVSLQIPLGLWLDLYGPRRILRYGILLCTAGTLLFALANSIFGIFLGRFVVGIGASIALIGGIRINALWMPPAYLAFSLGCLAAVGKLGGSLANGLLPVMIQSFSWRGALYILFGVGLALSLLLMIGLRDKPTHGVSAREDMHEGFVKVIRNPALWALGFYGYSLYLTLTVFADTYSIHFLTQSFHISQQQGGLLASLVGIGSALGSACFSGLSDLCKRRRCFLQICALGTLICSSLVFYTSISSLSLLGALLFSTGFFSGGQVFAFIVSSEIAHPRHIGVISGMMNTMLMAGGLLHNPLVGWLLQRNLDLGLAHAYRLSFFSLSFCFIIATILSFCIPESCSSIKRQ